jgi:hypothetical protein
VKFFVCFIESNGMRGKLADFETKVIKEVDPTQVHPVPSPLFDHLKDAQAYADARYPAFVAGEFERLSETGSNEYRSNPGLEAYHQFVIAEAKHYVSPAV